MDNIPARLRLAYEAQAAMELASVVPRPSHIHNNTSHAQAPQPPLSSHASRDAPGAAGAAGGDAMGRLPSQAMSQASSTGGGGGGGGVGEVALPHMASTRPSPNHVTWAQGAIQCMCVCVCVCVCVCHMGTWLHC